MKKYNTVTHVVCNIIPYSIYLNEKESLVDIFFNVWHITEVFEDHFKGISIGFHGKFYAKLRQALPSSA